MTQEVVIREYTPQDKPAVLELLRLNTPAYFSPEEEKDLIHYLEHERELYFVVEHDGTLAGCGGINFSGDPTTGKISWDIIHPAYQGKGLGRSLLQHRINLLKNRKQVRTISVRTSQLVYQFYERMGFELLEMVPDYWAPGFDLYRMEYTR
ncbi:GNAT family N-acetyltransferase [Rufibacter sp. H-1]|uniref:GNAT family N-acetyltransferase n=2 Tax=Rufibacter sediminis TaxID=2762756 RepID=A0ABR6VU47_9BACT|nr:GNAT family N-acetyltransferase [Rufibacter sediminis]